MVISCEYGYARQNSCGFRFILLFEDCRPFDCFKYWQPSDSFKDWLQTAPLFLIAVKWSESKRCSKSAENFYGRLSLTTMGLRDKTLLGSDCFEDCRPFDCFDKCWPSDCFKNCWHRKKKRDHRCPPLGATLLKLLSVKWSEVNPNLSFKPTK